MATSSLLLGAALMLSGPALYSASAAKSTKTAKTKTSKRIDIDIPTLTVHAAKSGVALSPDLYGVFFEEINHAGDGGLYAELVHNRDFQEVVDSKSEYLPGWNVPASAKLQTTMTLDADHPQNVASQKSLRLTFPSSSQEARVALVNSGYWGINVRKGARYQFSAYLKRSADMNAPIIITLQSAKGKVYSQSILKDVPPDWKLVKTRLTSNSNDPAAQLVISTASTTAEKSSTELSAASNGQSIGAGSLWLNTVSLFPAKTFKRRANGLRPDLAAHVNAMHPAFVRFPGGCYVEGNVLATRFNWKDTLGNIASRPGHLNDNWNYRSTDGLGYHEYLQWCEDLKATPLFVVNCGMAHHEFVPVDQLQPWVQDALDAIEYANGPATSKWGAVRAKNGHPAPFKLKYIEIGNENGLFGSNFGGSREQYTPRYKVFFDAIKAKYPDIVTVANTRVPYTMELVDDHYYNSPGWFWANIGIYDKYDRAGPKIYVGEYAVTSDCGNGNLKAALAEAAWMTGLERNGDVVKMTSYAPLFVNSNDRKWNPDAIVFDSARSYGTPSYYVQKLFAMNRPDTAFPVDVPIMPAPVGHGGIGLDTWLTQAEYKDIEVTQNGKTLYASDFAKGASEWRTVSGNWKVVDGAYRQTEQETDRRALLDAPQLNDLQDYTLHLKARKLGGAEGFIVMFRAKDANNYYWWNIGGWQNRESGIEKNVNGTHIDLGSHIPTHIETGRWYDIRVESQGSRVKCYLDDKLVYDFQERGLPTLAATAGRIDKSGEIIVKLVNGADTARNLEINLDGIDAIEPTGQATILTNSKIEAENTLTQPNNVVPILRTVTGVAPRFIYSVPAQSVVILRLKTR